jgi:hypothetical protein
MFRQWCTISVRFVQGSVANVSIEYDVVMVSYCNSVKTPLSAGFDEISCVCHTICIINCPITVPIDIAWCVDLKVTLVEMSALIKHHDDSSKLAYAQASPTVSYRDHGGIRSTLYPVG